MRQNVKNSIAYSVFITRWIIHRDTLSFTSSLLETTPCGFIAIFLYAILEKYYLNYCLWQVFNVEIAEFQRSNLMAWNGYFWAQPFYDIFQNIDRVSVMGEVVYNRYDNLFCDKCHLKCGKSIPVINSAAICCFRSDLTF